MNYVISIIPFGILYKTRDKILFCEFLYEAGSPSDIIKKLDSQLIPTPDCSQAHRRLSSGSFPILEGQNLCVEALEGKLD